MFDKILKIIHAPKPNPKAVKPMFDHDKETRFKPSTVYEASPLQTERNSLYLLRILMWQRAKGELNGIAALSEITPASEFNKNLATKIRSVITDLDYLIQQVQKR